jgi:hypothetical protein
MGKELRRTPVIDKNGKLTHVHKAAETAPEHSNLATAAPVLTETQRNENSLFHAPALSFGEVEEFLAFYASSVTGADAVFRSLSPKMQGLLWRARQFRVVDDDSITDLLSALRDDIRYSWKDSAEAPEVAEALMKSTLLVAWKLNDDSPPTTMERRTWMHAVRQSVIAYGYREGAFPRFSNEDELAPVVGVAAYTVAATEHYEVEAESRKFTTREYCDDQGLRFIGTGIANPVLEDYVREHPEMGYRVGHFVSVRDLGASKEDAQTVIDYFSETSDTVALGDGWL